MNTFIDKKCLFRVVLFISCCVYCQTASAQNEKLYPPFTKWYQDPLGLRPVELSSAAGFAWGSIAVAACLIFTKADSSFQHKLSFYQETGVGFGYKPPYTISFQNNTGVLYRIRDWMAVGLEWNTLHFSDGTNNTWSFGTRPFARWYAVSGRRASLFFEYGAGISYSLSRFPLTGTGRDRDTARTGTHFNFTTKYGVGAEMRITKKLQLQAGIRHFHLSNGNIKGIPRNPSHDSNGGFVGVLYALRKSGT